MQNFFRMQYGKMFCYNEPVEGLFIVLGVLALGKKFSRMLARIITPLLVYPAQWVILTQLLVRFFLNTCKHLVFFGSTFWKTSGVFDLVYNTSVGQPYHDLLCCEDSIDAIVNHLQKFQSERNLPLISNLEDLTKPFWINRSTDHISKDLPSV